LRAKCGQNLTKWPVGWLCGTSPESFSLRRRDKSFNSICEFRYPRWRDASGECHCALAAWSENWLQPYFSIQIRFHHTVTNPGKHSASSSSSSSSKELITPMPLWG
jgi:hypothetical protein